MALKCADVAALSNAIANKFSISADSSQMGKLIFRIDGFICTVYNNGTVQFQGRENPEVKAYIEDAVQKLNSILS